MVKSRILEPVILGVFWVLLFASPIFLGYQQSGTVNWIQVRRVWQSFIPYLLLFLINRLILIPFLFFTGKYWFFILANVVFIALLAFSFSKVSYGKGTSGHMMRQREGRMQGMDPVPHPPTREFEPSPEMGRRGSEPGQLFPAERPPRRGFPFYLNFMIVAFLMVGFETGLAVTFRWMESEKERIRSEKESISNQLAFLRNQVSPHFFMNTLNNIHALVDIDTEKAKDTLIRLSRLMRHLLYDAEVDRIPLEKELDFISHYVSLMKLRYGDHVDVRLDFPPDGSGESIPPLLFTNFIENAFKHGVSASAPSFVHISFDRSPGWIIFRIRNSVFLKAETPESMGIGISNTRKRLDLLYGKRYQLDIFSGAKDYSVTLKLPV